MSKESEKKFLKVIKKVSVFACVNKFQRVTDYLCNTSKSYLSPFRKFLKGNWVPHAIWLNLHAVLHYQFAKRTQITFCSVAKGNRLPCWPICLRYPRIACNAVRVSNIPLGELNFNKIKRRPDKKILLPSAIHIHIKAYPTIPLSDQSQLSSER